MLNMNQEIIDQMYPTATTGVQTEPTTTPLQSDVVDQMYGDTPVPKPSTAQTTGEVDKIEAAYEQKEKAVNPYSLNDEESTESQLGYADSERVELADDVDLTIIYGDEADQAALKDNLAFIGSAIGAEQQQISSLVESCNEYLITGECPPEQETMKALYQDFGTDLHTQLADAQMLVKSFPDLHQWLENTNAGNSPAIIRQILKLSQTNRSQARLKTLRNK